MKKSTKILLVGVGIAAIGIIAYVLLKKKDTEAQEKSIEEEKSSTAGCLSTEEFIKRRKERAARMREAKKLAEKSEPFANSDVSNNDITTKKTDTDTTTMDTESVFDDQTTEVSHVAKDMINQNENQD